MSVRSVGLFLAGTVGASTFIISQLAFTIEQEFGIHPFLLISLIYLSTVGFYQCVPETLGVESGDHIQEMVDESQKLDEDSP